MRIPDTSLPLSLTFCPHYCVFPSQFSGHLTVQLLLQLPPLSSALSPPPRPCRGRIRIRTGCYIGKYLVGTAILCMGSLYDGLL